MGGDAVIVLDTHVIIWDALKPELISSKAAGMMTRANETDGILFCEISLWEIAMLIHKGRICIETSYRDFVRLLKASNKYIFYGISPQVAELSTKLPSEVNNDPADRIISATAITENAPLITADKNLRKAKCVRTIW